VRSTPTKTTIESDWEALLTEMRKAREHGVPGIDAREIADVERKLETIRENERAVARILLRVSRTREISAANERCVELQFIAFLEGPPPRAYQVKVRPSAQTARHHQALPVLGPGRAMTSYSCFCIAQA
jgi:hypothetical protein